MSGYDPRAVTGIPTEPVGSLPRPTKLQNAYLAYDSGSITFERLEAEQEAAARDSIERLEDTGAPIISDGEQRRSSFATYALADTLAGTGLADHLSSTGGQLFAIFADGHLRQLPRLTGGPFRYRTYAAEELSRSIGLTDRPMKQAVIAPSMLALLYPLDVQIPGYPRAQFYEDLVYQCEKDIRKAFAVGAARVSIDFTEGRLSNRNDPRNPWTGRHLLPGFVRLNNILLGRFTPEERTRIGIHTCPGSDRDSVHSADVDYHELLPSLFQMNAGYFLIQLASERDRDRVCKLIGENIRDDADGVAQMAYLGVINTVNPRVESPEEVMNALERAANFIPRERLGSTDDCGFSPFSIDEKPNHGSPEHAREIAFQKIRNRIRGTMAAAEKLGVG
jgi:methionine synthase II (cobalamin-independent)